MDPVTGKIYKMNDPHLSKEIRDRLIPIEDLKAFQKELNEVKELVDLHEKVMLKPEEIPYSPNRATRRAQSKRDRALNKRNPRD